MSHKIPVVGFVSLGCPKALVDTERIVTELRARGYRIGTSYHDADIVIVNTRHGRRRTRGRCLRLHEAGRRLHGHDRRLPARAPRQP